LDFESTEQKYKKQKTATKARRKREQEIAREIKENNKPYIVDQYDLNGNYISSFKTMQTAARTCGGTAGNAITHCCNRNPLYKKAYGYI
jgi:hypothetical protein